MNDRQFARDVATILARDLAAARAEITALTKERDEWRDHDSLAEQRDAMKAVIEAARECEHCWNNVVDSFGPPQKGWWTRLEAALPKLRQALEALPTLSTEKGVDSP